ncbi:hypothetical protein STEPF1_01557 [Streptomyces sp. F-1]|nr:hypothetical protein STEPF1_01557 [Streptomyces sp. F-1]
MSGRSVRVNDSARSEPAPEDGKHDPEGRGAAPEDGRPASLAAAAKNLFDRHKAKLGAVVAVGAMGLAVVGVVARLAEGQDAEDIQDTEDSLSAPGLDVADRPQRKSPAGHEVVATLVKLAAGRQASAERRAAYKEETGEDLPAGSTYRSKHRRGDFGEDGSPGEAAA